MYLLQDMRFSHILPDNQYRKLDRRLFVYNIPDYWVDQAPSPGIPATHIRRHTLPMQRSKFLRTHHNTRHCTCPFLRSDIRSFLWSVCIRSLPKPDSSLQTPPFHNNRRCILSLSRPDRRMFPPACNLLHKKKLPGNMLEQPIRRSTPRYLFQYIRFRCIRSDSQLRKPLCRPALLHNNPTHMSH